MLAVVVLLSATAALITPAAKPTPTPAAAPLVEPEKQEVLALLFRNSGTRLSEGRYCGNAVAGAPAPTIGDWLAKLMSDMDSGDNTVEVACDKPAKPDSPDASWTCHVDLVHADGDDQWKWGMDLGLRVADRTLARGSLACTNQ